MRSARYMGGAAGVVRGDPRAGVGHGASVAVWAAKDKCDHSSIIFFHNFGSDYRVMMDGVKSMFARPRSLGYGHILRIKKTVIKTGTRQEYRA